MQHDCRSGFHALEHLEAVVTFGMSLEIQFGWLEITSDEISSCRRAHNAGIVSSQSLLERLYNLLSYRHIVTCTKP